MNEIHYMTPTTSDLQLPIYLTGIGVWDNQDDTFRIEGFHEYQLSFVQAGEGELRLENTSTRVRAGEFFYLPPHIAHSYHATKPPWQVIWITFDGHYTETLLRISGLLKPGVYRTDGIETVNTYMNQLLELGRDRLAGHGTACSKLLYSTLLDVRQQIAGDGATSHQMSERLQPVLQYIEEHYKRNISLKEMAQIIHVTPQHLCLLFKRTFQLRPIAYLNTIRIHKSKELIIRHLDWKINEIAREVGFDNPSYFNTVFKAYTGSSPIMFKKTYFSE